MASLSLTFGSLSLAAHDLQIRMLGWRKVGSCRISVNSPFEIAATGNYNALGQTGNFDIKLTLDDNDAAATGGPCTIVLAGKSWPGTYVLSGTALTFSDGKHTVAASSDSGGVILAISGYPKARIAP